MRCDEKQRFGFFLATLLPGLLWMLLGILPGMLLAPCPLNAQEVSAKETIIHQIVHYIKGKNVRMPDETLRRMANTVYAESRLYALDYRLVLAVIRVESNFKQEAVSNKGARGLMQVKPSLAKYIARDAGVSVKGSTSLAEPENNVRLGVHYLSRLMEDFEDLGRALHAYNTGPAKLKGKPTSDDEPKNKFAKRVLREYQNTIEVLPEDE
jgi:soluble lytic murein transglycosylase